MFARLWWKEYRAFGPAWLVLVGAAVLLQWFFLAVDSDDVRAGALTASALAWAVLYAFASGAAAFAGEREAKTLGFLDALPVGRWTLWLGKASFALASTVGLALALAVLAALGTATRDPDERYGYASILLVFGTILFEAVAWSLLWSSLTKNPLMAGVLGVLSVYVSAVLISTLPGLDHRLASNDLVGKESAPVRWLAALAALGVSGLVMAWRPRPRPRVVKAKPARPPVAIRTTSTARSLVWQARREGLTTWLLAVLVAWVLPVAIVMSGSQTDGMGVPVALAVLACLVSGVSVFGLENASGGRRFLVQHGVAAGSAWWRRFLVWATALGLIFGIPAALSGVLVAAHSGPAASERIKEIVGAWLALANGFAVGLLCGMTITRRITATLVAVIVLVAVLPLQFGIVLNGMAPAWGLFLVPLIFVAASRAWADDWLIEREGVRPWLRLGAWLAVPSTVLFAAYASYRAYGLPDVGPQFNPASLQLAPIPPGEDAAVAYDRAMELYQRSASLFNAANGSRSQLIDGEIAAGWQAADAEVVAYWEKNKPAIEQARRASALARGRFEDLSRMTIFSGSGRSMNDLDILAQLLALDDRERLSRDDVAGAWDDIAAQLRMASQLGADSPTSGRMMLAVKVHSRAVALAFSWLGAPGQSPATLSKALADLKALPPVPDAAETMRADSAVIERTLDRFDDELAASLTTKTYGFRSTLGSLWSARVVAAPWERQRARRVNRLLVAWGLPDVTVEPYRRGTNVALNTLEEAEIRTGWTLARTLSGNFEGLIARLDHQLADRRALEQAVAIEAWKLGHEGKYPETLDALVPDLLPRLPLDPFSGKSFGYIRSDGREVHPLFRDDRDLGIFTRPTRVGQPLLYSFGPGMKDNGGRSFREENRFTFGDYVFPIP